MLRSSIATTSLFVGLSCIVGSGCARGLNGPDDQESLLLGDITTTSGSSGAGGAKANPATTSVTSAANAATSVTVGPSAQASTSAQTSTTGGGTCEALGDCGNCGNCAIAGQCQPAMSACQADQNCIALVDCLSNCQDQTCADGCATQYPGGQAGYTAVVMCVVCEACPISCDATAMGGCAP